MTLAKTVASFEVFEGRLTYVVLPDLDFLRPGTKRFDVYIRFGGELYVIGREIDRASVQEVIERYEAHAENHGGDEFVYRLLDLIDTCDGDVNQVFDTLIKTVQKAARERFESA